MSPISLPCGGHAHSTCRCVSLYTEREIHPLSILKEDAPPVTRVSLYSHNGRRVRFHDKRRRARVPSSVRLLYLNNRRHAIKTHFSLLSQKRTRLRYKLNWDVPKRRSSPFYPPSSQFCSSLMWARLILLDMRRSFKSSYLICMWTYLLFEFLTKCLIYFSNYLPITSANC
jgi:hypothetical protein